MKSTNTRILDGKWRLDTLGARSFPWALLLLLLAAMLVAWKAAGHGFPKFRLAPSGARFAP